MISLHHYHMLRCLMCSNCIVALHQRNRFEVSEKTNRVSRNLSLWKLNILIDSIKFESLIARYRNLFNDLKSYRFFDRSFEKNRYFIRRINMISLYHIIYSFSIFAQMSILLYFNQWQKKTTIQKRRNYKLLIKIFCVQNHI